MNGAAMYNRKNKNTGFSSSDGYKRGHRNDYEEPQDYQAYAGRWKAQAALQKANEDGSMYKLKEAIRVAEELGIESKELGEAKSKLGKINVKQGIREALATIKAPLNGTRMSHEEATRELEYLVPFAEEEELIGEELEEAQLLLAT